LILDDSWFFSKGRKKPPVFYGSSVHQAIVKETKNAFREKPRIIEMIDRALSLFFQGF